MLSGRNRQNRGKGVPDFAGWSRGFGELPNTPRGDADPYDQLPARLKIMRGVQPESMDMGLMGRGLGAVPLGGTVFAGSTPS